MPPKKKKEAPVVEVKADVKTKTALALPDLPSEYELQEKALQKIQRDFGEQCLKVDEQIINYAAPEHRLLTQLQSLNYVTCGGLVRGAGAVQMHSAENVGKSTASALLAGFVQCVLNEDILWVASEAFDKVRAAMCGVRFGTRDQPLPPGHARFWLAEETSSAESLIDVTQRAVATGRFGLVIVDSVAALRSADEYNKPMKAHYHAMRQPTLTGRFVVKLKKAQLTAPRTAVLLLNQVRDTQPDESGDPQETHYPGGRQLRHLLLAALRGRYGGHIVVERGNKDDPPTKVGRRMDFEAEKLKLLGPDGWKAGVEVYGRDCPEHGYLRGEFNAAREIREIAEMKSVISVEGIWRKFQGQTIGQGKENTEKMIKGEPELFQRLTAACREAWAQDAKLLEHSGEREEYLASLKKSEDEDLGAEHEAEDKLPALPARVLPGADDSLFGDE